MLIERLMSPSIVFGGRPRAPLASLVVIPLKRNRSKGGEARWDAFPPKVDVSSLQ